MRAKIVIVPTDTSLRSLVNRERITSVRTTRSAETTIEGARLVTVRNAAHLPSLERTDAVNALLLVFLGDR
jgi:pimeloyl-ACP methyl ester carboxylesterase